MSTAEIPKRSFSALLLLLFGVALIAGGCGTPEREIVATPQPIQPLSVAEWQALTDVSVKYDPSSFERLQAGDPKLKSDAAWERFFRDVVVPQRLKDVPGG